MFEIKIKLYTINSQIIRQITEEVDSVDMDYWYLKLPTYFDFAANVAGMTFHINDEFKLGLFNKVDEAFN
jgi:hypothetical protein